MSHPALTQLTRAEQLFDDGKLDEALELLNDWSQFVGLNSQQKDYHQFLKGLILTYQNKSEEVFELGEQIFKEGQKANDNLQSFDGLFFTLIGLCLAYNFDDALGLIEKAETLLGSISNASINIIIRREIRLSVLKAWINMNTGNIDLAEKCLERAIGCQNEVGNTFEIVWANILMTQIMLRVKIKIDLAIEYTKKALFMAERIKFNQYWIALSHLYFGRTYLAFTEYKTALKHFMKSLKIFKKTKNTYWVARLLNSTGVFYTHRGEFDRAKKYYEESILLYETLPLGLEFPLDNLIDLYLDLDDIENAQIYFHRLEKIYDKKKDRHIEVIYKYNKAQILKRSLRIRDKAKAEKLFKQVIESKTILNELIRDSLIELCDLLLAEFRTYQNPEVLDEINHIITQLLTRAEKSHSFLIFCETFILQAKLALVNFDVKASRRFFTQAQKIAEKYGIKRLAMNISYEHDELLKQLKTWEELKESESDLSERWELAGLKEQMENIKRKQLMEVPEILDEDPIFLLIVSEGGIPLLSHSFIEEKSIESQILGGFLTTIDYFIKEMFSEGLDRAIFGEYTLLMKSIPPFFISYIFKGDSYYALQKTNYFIDQIQKENEIWQNLVKSFHINQSVNLKDIPMLDSLITETFTTKTVVKND